MPPTGGPRRPPRPAARPPRPRPPTQQFTGTETSLAPQQQQSAGNNPTQHQVQAQHNATQPHTSSETSIAPRQQQRAGNNPVQRRVNELYNGGGNNTPTETRPNRQQRRIGRSIPNPKTGRGGTDGGGSSGGYSGGYSGGRTYSKSGSYRRDDYGPTLRYAGSVKSGGVGADRWDNDDTGGIPGGGGPGGLGGGYAPGSGGGGGFGGGGGGSANAAAAAARAAGAGLGLSSLGDLSGRSVEEAVYGAKRTRKTGGKKTT